MITVDIQSDDEILPLVPKLAKRCIFMQFTSGEQCKSMEEWQRIFEANGFEFVGDAPNVSTRTQMYRSLKHDVATS